MRNGSYEFSNKVYNRIKSGERIVQIDKEAQKKSSDDFYNKRESNQRERNNEKD